MAPPKRGLEVCFSKRGYRLEKKQHRGVARPHMSDNECLSLPFGIAVHIRAAARRPAPCPYRKSNPDVLMVQASEVRVGDDAANSLNSTRRWCILVQR
jgi:hypothetical protein